MNSLQLLDTLHRRGTLTKEATVRILGQREGIVKRAYAAAVRDFWESFFASDLVKEGAPPLDLWDRMKQLARGAPAVVPKKGFFGNFGHGGFAPDGPNRQASGWGDVGSNLLKMLGIAGLSAGATAGVSSLVRHHNDKQLQADIKGSYEKMFQEHPRLQDMNQDKVRTNFGVLAKFAPSLAADPTVAGSFVVSATTMGVVDPKTVQGLAEAQRRIDEMHESHSPFSQHFDRGVQVAQKAMNPFTGGGPGGGSAKSG